MIGAVVSHYEVIEHLGGGGMGVVYRGLDLKLGRGVALKFLPEDLTSDSLAVERFEREARAAAAITHPNICTVYEIGEFNGTPFIVMELLEGETLKRKMRGRPVPVDRFLHWAIQIAQGLEAAHGRGIVHRDLKPANLFVTKVEQVKILDFGLAKLRFTRRAGIAGGFDNTMTALESDPNIALGTPAYMSPEQARGEELDARTDFFSTGVLFYEMATGKLPFQGPNAATLMASILRDSPQPPCEANPELPPHLGRIVGKALEKDPDKRYQTATDLCSDLYRLKREIGSGGTNLLVTVPSGMQARKRPAMLRWLIAGTAILITAAIAIFLLMRPLPPPTVSGMTQITSDRRAKAPPFLTDGSRVYFNTGAYLSPQPYQVSVEGGDSVPLPVQLPSVSLRDISPDRLQFLVGSFGNNPYLFTAVTLWTTPVLGGSPRRVGDLVVVDAAWSPDAQQLVFTKEVANELDVARMDGTEIRKLVSVAGIPQSPRWSPDGKTIRFTIDRSTEGVTPGSSLWEVSADGSHLHPLFPKWRDAQCCGNWTRDGRYFVFQVASKGVTTIWAVREKHNFFQSVSHEPVKLITGPMSTYAPLPSVDGKRLFVGARQARMEIVRYDVKAWQFVPFLDNISAEGLDFSRDGKWVTYVTHPEGTLWRSTINGEQRLQLTSPPLQAILPRWSPDGSRIVFMGRPPGQPDKIFVVSAEGGRVQQLTNGPNNDPTWSPDGKSLAFAGYPLNPRDPQEHAGVQILDLNTHQTSTLPDSEGRWSPRWSPDGRFLITLTSDTKTLVAFDFRSKKWKEVVVNKAGFGYPSWSRDSAYVYVDTLGDDPVFCRVRMRDGKLERIVSLKGIQRQLGVFGPWAGLAPDGSPLISRDISFDEIYAFDWHAP